VDDNYLTKNSVAIATSVTPRGALSEHSLISELSLIPVTSCIHDILPQANPAAPQPAVISRLKLKDPDVWSGKRSTLPGFPTSRRVKFMIEKHNFIDEISEIGYAGSFLNGTPADWWHGLFHRYKEAVDKGNSYPVELTSFAEFSRALTTSFGDPDVRTGSESPGAWMSESMVMVDVCC
jgi:hypothetical protein